jgi:carboxymethylenebutenolidase
MAPSFTGFACAAIRYQVTVAPMRTSRDNLRFGTLALLFVLTSAALATEQPASLVPETVVILSGKLRLKAFFWRPKGPGPFPAVLFCHGSGADADHTAGLPIKEAAEKLAPLFLKHGYAFLYLFRRGQGLSAGQGPFMQDVLRREEATKGKGPRQHLQFILATTDHLDDVLAALAFLKTAPGVDAKRIAIVGHSFGGQLTLLAAERDSSVRAAVAFAAAANSWERSPELRERLRAAADKATAPIMLIQAANDYSTAPSQQLANELERLHKPHLLKIYPSVGKTADDGHNFLYLAIPRWEHDVFRFLDEHVKR